MLTFEIYFSDLKEDTQKQLLDLLGYKSPEDANWNSEFQYRNIAPLTILEFDESILEDSCKEESLPIL